MWQLACRESKDLTRYHEHDVILSEPPEALSGPTSLLRVEGPRPLEGVASPFGEHGSMEKRPAVYMLASRSRVLYIGVTSDLLWRIWKHKTGVFEGFSKKYHANRLVYFERFPSMRLAILREKQLKGWRRSKKVELIEKENPNWADLAHDWYDDPFWCMPREREVGVYGYLQ